MQTPILNIAQICPVTEALGPGLRFVIWVQGCPFNCHGCVSPEWISDRPAHRAGVDELAAYIIKTARLENLEGITLSGGEPMRQADGLARLLEIVRHTLPDFSAISFSGYTAAQLRKKALTDAGIDRLLSGLDVLIDGLYVAERNDAKGMRGSSNQRVHFLTERYKHLEEDFNRRPRRVEVHLLDGEMLLVGVPTRKTLADFSLAAGKLREIEEKSR